MKTKYWLLFLSLPALLTSCLYGQCINGPCALERAEMIKAIKPFGAHWVKDGMTRESRRGDLAVCGSYDLENVMEFPSDKLSAARLPSDANEVNAMLRLRQQVGQCMQSKGYQPIGDLKFLGGCDDRCMYP